MTVQMGICLVILVFAVVFYSTSWFSLTTTSFLILTALWITGIVDAADLFSTITNAATLMVIFMFIVSGALVKTGVSALIGKFILINVKSERHAMLRVMLLAIVLSAFFSNMAAAVVCCTFAIGMCQSNKEIRLTKLLMAVAMGAMAGGMLTIIGVSGNVMVRSILEENNLGTVGFWDFGKIGLPVSIVTVLYMFFIGYRLSPSVPAMEQNIEMEQAPEVDKKKALFTGIVFILVVVGMMFEKQIGAPIQITSFLGCVVLLAFRIITEREAFSYVSWPASIMFATLLTLGTAIAKTGAAQLIADGLVAAMGPGASPTLVLAVFAIALAILTQFMSNGATAAVFYPVGLSLATTLGLNPASVLMMTCIAASASFCTPMATPLNAYLMSVAGYKFSDFVKVGTPLLILIIILIVILCPIMWPVA